MKRFPAMLGIALLGALLVGCATTRGDAPNTPKEVLAQVALQGAIVAGVDRLVTRNNATPADIEARALRVINIASGLKALGSDSLSTLPKINAALAPMLDRLDLSPVERNQANLLVSALVTVGLERSNVRDYVAQVAFILDEVIRAAGAYVSDAERQS